MSSLFNAAVGVVALYFLFKRGDGFYSLGYPSAGAESPVVEYKDFVAILLTALGVMIGVAAFIVALVAIWGIAEGKKMLESIAQKTAEAAAIKRTNELVPRIVGEALAFQESETHIEESDDRIATSYGEEPPVRP